MMPVGQRSVRAKKGLPTIRYVTGLLLLLPWACGASAEEMPAQIQKALDRFVGSWRVEIDQGGPKGTAGFECEWSAGKAALIYRWTGPNLVGQAPMTAFGTLGWDGSSKTVRERSFGSDGSTFTATHAINAIDGWESPAEGTFADAGKYVRSTRTRVITWKNDDQWIVADKDSKLDGQPAPSTTSTFRRVTAVPRQSTPDEFREYGNAFSGRWVQDITLIADWPGLSKKQGDKVIGHETTRWLGNDRVLETDGHLLENFNRGVTYWDPATRQIRLLNVNSAGSVGHAILWKADGVWRWNYEEGHLDGKKAVGTGTIKLEDNGSTSVLEGTLYLDSGQLPPLRDVSKRVGK